MKHSKTLATLATCLAVLCATLAAAPTYTALLLSGSSSGVATIQAAATAGTPVLTLPTVTATIATTTGSTTTNDCAKFDSSGRIVDAGAACAAGSGTVTTSGTPATGNLTKFSGSSAITNGDLSGDCTTSGALAVTCTKTNGVAFATSATTDTTSASNISSGTLAAARGGAGTVNGALKGNGSGAVSQAACADLSNGGTACAATIGTSGATVPLLNTPNTFGAQQSSSITTLSISTATFTPDGTNNNYKLTLVHASCPCTLANPSATPVAGTSGQIEIVQSSTGSDTIGTWGSSYIAPGGTSTITLSTTANAIDILSYYVIDSTHIALSPSLNFSH